MPKQTELIGGPETPKCLTKWEIFDEGSLIPVRVTCQDYQPTHQVDTSCHTNLLVNANSILSHIAPEHGSGGGFEIQLRHREGAKTNFWKELKESGVELHDFRCDVCNDSLINLNPRRIMKHTQAHSGKTRSAKNGGKFLMTMQTNKPVDDGQGNWEDF